MKKLIRQIWALRPFIGIAIILIATTWALITGFNNKNKKQYTQTASATQQTFTSPLEETCKDWIFNRNKAYKYGREGNQLKAEEARRAMLSFMADLQKQYTEEQISGTIARLENSGYRAGF